MPYGRNKELGSISLLDIVLSIGTIIIELHQIGR